MEAELPIPIDKQTFLQKLLFYTTAFFILLGTFSLFAFLFLVPFVIDPAFTTIFMDFDTRPALCVTIDVESRRGTSNCSWTSCREGCTKELFECTQIRVNYKLPVNVTAEQLEDDDEAQVLGGVGKDEAVGKSKVGKRSLHDYDYVEEYEDDEHEDYEEEEITDPKAPTRSFPTGLMGNDSEWYFMGAKLFPNVKGCGYPPMLNCTIFVRQYANIGQNFSCYYSKVDPGIVISDLDMWQVYMNLVYAMAIPIPSFIIAVIYLTIAYFKIYNEDEAALAKAAEAAAAAEEGLGPDGEKIVGEDGATPVPLEGGCSEEDEDVPDGAMTPTSCSDALASFGHELKVAMVDDNSRESLDGIPDCYSVQGNLSKTMTTSISTRPGPMATV